MKVPLNGVSHIPTLLVLDALQVYVCMSTTYDTKKVYNHVLIYFNPLVSVLKVYGLGLQSKISCLF